MDRLQASAEAILADLVSFPSLSGTPNGPIIGYIKDYFENLGIPVTLDAHAHPWARMVLPPHLLNARAIVLHGPTLGLVVGLHLGHATDLAHSVPVYDN